MPGQSEPQREIPALERASGERPRLPWIDVAKGICIILVVMMHSTLGVERETGQAGWLHAVVSWAKPFRMPDFFFLSGLLAGSVLRLDRRTFSDRKVLHFVYFYLLWLAIVLFVKIVASDAASPTVYVMALLAGLIEPFSTLWFIYILPFFFILVWIARGRWFWLLVAVSILLHLAAAAYPVDGRYAMASDLTGWMAIDSFSLFLVFFVLGFGTRNAFPHWLDRVASRPWILGASLALWAGFHSFFWTFGVTSVPGATIVFGLAGAVAVTGLSVLLAQAGLGGWLAYCGRHSLVIYLAFVIPMAVARRLLLARPLIEDSGTIALAVTIIAVVVPLVIERAVRGSYLQFLFYRPGWARLVEARA